MKTKPLPICALYPSFSHCMQPHPGQLPTLSQPLAIVTSGTPRRYSCVITHFPSTEGDMGRAQK
jgi:hypothetical protein